MYDARDECVVGGRVRAMKAMVVAPFGRAESARMVDRPPPRPGARDVLVRVHATSVNPIDWKLRSSLLRFVPLATPRVLGYDFSGVVVERGRAANELVVGDEVFGMLPALRGGGNAEMVVALESELAHKPRSVSHVEAATIPLAGLTALQALERRGRMAAGDRVLVIGASGGVGAFAVQIAAARGAHVTGVSSSRNVELVRSLGAHEAVAYDRSAVSGTFDVVFDAVGTSSFFGMRRHLSPRGRFVTTLATPANAVSFALFPWRSKLVITKRRGEDLAELARLVDAGRVRATVERAYPLADLASAYARSRTGRVVGKLAVVVISDRT